MTNRYCYLVRGKISRNLYLKEMYLILLSKFKKKNIIEETPKVDPQEVLLTEIRDLLKVRKTL